MGQQLEETTQNQNKKWTDLYNATVIQMRKNIEDSTNERNINEIHNLVQKIK